MPTPVSRRAALGGLAALGAAGVSGCTSDGGDRTPLRTGTPSRPPDDPDVALAATVLRDEQAMLDRVVATAHRHPRLAGAVAGARAAHRAHVELLTRAVPPDAVPVRPSPRPSPQPSPQRSPQGAPRVPDTAAVALAALARAEDRLAGVGRRSALAARSGPFARVLASMAAAASQQAVRIAAEGRR